MLGQTLGHYRILQKLGEGGMGVVFRARDEKLDRDVALKVLSPGTLSDDSARKRFRKEALLLARLSHQNVGMVFDFDSVGETDFLTMELVAGESLDKKLAAGAVMEREVLALGVQIASALEEAHEKGVVHRDLKPGNIILTPKGHVKVLDFGLATIVQPQGEAEVTASITETCAVRGTVPYMSPEQLRAKEVDARTDLYALGAVLYELTTGQRPFRDASSAGLIDEILNRPAPPPRQTKPHTSAELERIILKCLEKEPANRYQSAKEIVVDLRRLAAPTPTSIAVPPVKPRRGLWVALAGAAITAVLAAVFAFGPGGVRDRLFGGRTHEIKSLAVLPLENLSGDPQQEYFADGMTESLITELSHIGALKVISRTSVMQYKGARKPLPEIARQLNVDAVIEGSVMREGDQVKITVQLIHAPSDTHLWAQDYVREMRGILSLQSEVARAIAGQVKAALTPAEAARFASSRSVDLEAYDLYLRGKVLADRPENMLRAIEFFEQATTKDPSFASGYGALGYGLIIAHNEGQLARSEAFPRAQKAAQRAIELDSEDLDAMKAQVAVTFTILRDYQGAERIMRHIVERAPNDGETHTWLGQTLSLYGRFDESIVEARRGVELSPRSLESNAMLALIYLFARRYDQCIEQGRAAVDLGPNSFISYWALTDCYDGKGMFDDGVKAYQKLLLLVGADPALGAQLAVAQAKEGFRARIQLALAQSLQNSEKSNLSPGDIACFYALLGDKDRAFRYLERAYQEYDSWIFQIQHPAFDSLRGDPRWHAFLRRLNLQDTPMAKLPAAPAPAAR